MNYLSGAQSSSWGYPSATPCVSTTNAFPPFTTYHLNNIPLQGFIQKFLFGVEVGVALSRTVGPHEVLHNVFLYINLVLVNIIT